MKLSSRRHERQTKLDLNMTPMIDMIFLLLIFFITTAAFVATERHLDSAIQQRQSGAASASDLEPAIVDIVPRGAAFVFKVGSREMTSQDELTGVLRQFPNKLDGAYVRVQDEAPFGLAAAAIQACKNADFVVVSYVPLGTPPP